MTPEREEKIRQVLRSRQLDLTVVFENISDQHNIAAALRTCDAIGIQQVHIISPNEKTYSKFSRKSSASAAKWITIHHYTNVKECFDQLRKNSFRIYSTLLGKNSVDLYQMDFIQRIAIVFGNEHEGVSTEAASLSDGNFLIPQVGMIQSLNLSVACAVTLYEAFRQRRENGMYNNSNSAAIEILFKEWVKK